jgi:trimeric autotransporter adhesin
MKKQILTTLSIAFIAGSLVFTSCKKDDATAPVVTLTGAATVSSVLNEAYTDPGATAKDEKDGTVTVTSDFSSKFNKDLAGTYVITYTATDAAGNVGTATRTIDVANSAKNLAGSYAVAGNQTTSGPGAGAYTYTDAVTASSTTNNRVLVTKYAGYSNANVYFVISGTTVTVPEQTVLSGSPASNRKLSGTGTISAAGVISLSYTEVTNGSTAVGTLVYTKQ